MTKVTEIIICPSCGSEFDWSFEVPTRAKTGLGTQKRITRLTRNHIQLCDTVLHNQFKTVKEIRDIMHHRGLKFQTKKVERYWDYHVTQAQLSLLVGNGFVSMTEPAEEYFDFMESRFKVSPAPRYYMTHGNAKKYSRWMKAQHKIIVRLPPPLDDFVPAIEVKGV